jgi:hypothetical protein
METQKLYTRVYIGALALIRKYLWCILLLLTLLEAAAFTYGRVFSVPASRLWMCFFVLFVLLSFRLIIRAVALDIRGRNYIAVALLAGVLVYLFWGAGDVDIRGLNYESTQQAAAGLRAFSSADWEYTRLGYLGYPMRQYLVLALPSLLLGRSMLALQLAYDIIFAMCALTFYSGLRIYAERRGLPRLVAVLPVLAVFCSQYILEYALIREQAELPPAFAMAACGWFAVFYLDVSDGGGHSGSAAALAFCAAFLGSMYTPGLALAAFSVYTLLYMLIRRFRQRQSTGWPLLASMAMYIAVTAAFSVITIQKTNSQLDMDSVSLSFVFDAIKQIVTEDPVGLYRYLTPVVIAYAAASALGFFSVFDLSAVAWAFFSICAALLMRGYTSGTDVSIQRAMVVIPVVSTILMYRFIGIFHNGSKRAAAAAGLFMAATITLNLLAPRPLTHIINEKSSKTLTYVTIELQKKLKEPEYRGKNPVLVFFPGSSWDGQIRDYTCYITPELSEVITPEPSEFDSGGVKYAEQNGIIFCSTGDAEIPLEVMRKYGKPRVDQLVLGGYDIEASWVFVDPASLNY